MASQVPITTRAQPVNGSSVALRGKKRPGSPAVSPSPPAPASSSCSSSNSSTSNNNSNKKKKGPLPTTTAAQTQAGLLLMSHNRLKPLVLFQKRERVSYAMFISGYTQMTCLQEKKKKPNSGRCSLLLRE